jgi:hypothetical protein
MKRKEVPSRLLALSAGLVVAVGLSSLYAFNTGEPKERPVPAQSQGMKARVQFEVLGTYRDRATGSTRAETHVSLGRGQSVTRYVRAGDVNDPSILDPPEDEILTPDMKTTPDLGGTGRNVPDKFWLERAPRFSAWAATPRRTSPDQPTIMYQSGTPNVDIQVRLP